MPDFFDVSTSFERRIEYAINTRRLSLLQLFIGVRNPVALRQYCAAFYISCINIMTIQRQANEASLQLTNYYLEQINDDWVVPVGGDTIGIMQSTLNICSSLCQRDLANMVLLPNPPEDSARAMPCALSEDDRALESYFAAKAYVVDDKLHSLKSYVRDTDIAILCPMTIAEVNEAYKKITHDLARDLSELINENTNSGHDASFALVEKLHQLEQEREKYDDSLRRCREKLLVIKRDRFFLGWYKDLLQQELKAACADADHPWQHRAQRCVLQSDAASFSTAKVDSLIQELRVLWNKELISRALDKAMASIKADPDCVASARAELLREKGLRLGATDDIMYNTMQVFGRLKTAASRSSSVAGRRSAMSMLCHNLNSVDAVKEHMKRNMSLAYLLEAEQDMLKLAADYAKKQNNCDAIALLICNGVGDVAVKSSGSNTSAPEVIEHLYNAMIIRDLYDTLPITSAEDIANIFPDDSGLRKAAISVLAQEKLLGKKGEETDVVQQILETKYAFSWNILKWSPVFRLRYKLMEPEKRKEQLIKAKAELTTTKNAVAKSAAFMNTELVVRELSNSEYFSLNKATFGEVRQISKNDHKPSISFGELATTISSAVADGRNVKEAKDLVLSKELDKEKTKEEIDKQAAVDILVQQEQEKTKEAENKTKEAENKTKEAENKASAERIAKEQADREKKATTMFFLEAVKKLPPDKITADISIIHQFTFVISYQDIKAAYHKLQNKYDNLATALRDGKITHQDASIQLTTLAAERATLDEQLQQSRSEERNFNHPIYGDEDIADFAEYTTNQVSTARQSAEHSRLTLGTKADEVLTQLMTLQEERGEEVADQREIAVKFQQIKESLQDIQQGIDDVRADRGLPSTSLTRLTRQQISSDTHQQRGAWGGV